MMNKIDLINNVSEVRIKPAENGWVVDVNSLSTGWTIAVFSTWATLEEFLRQTLRDDREA